MCGEQNNQKLPERQQKLSAVLLIDDDKDILTVLKRSLELKGVNTYGFTNPVLAVEHFKNNAASYDIVVTDIRMPQMNGFEVARAVKEIRPDIKLAFITAFEINKSEFEKVLPSTNVDAFITKPVKSDTFVEVIKGIM
ncbi:MAG: response regulator [Thermoproteota archaeon]|nr:response regulator [Thermoproteota archaeon]